MGSKDRQLQWDIKNILQGHSVGQNLIAYFDALPPSKIRRAITVLSSIYPEKTTLADDELMFITHMLENEKYLVQESFYSFIRSLGILSFTPSQKDVVAKALKERFELLCSTCTFELDSLITQLFKPHELIDYMKELTETHNTAVLIHLADILRYEDFSDSTIPDETLATLKHKISLQLKQANEDNK